MTFDRRSFLRASGVLVAAACAPRVGTRDDAVAIDGNLVAPLDDEHPPTAEEIAAVRSSGLTAIKLTIGGDAGSYRDTIAELAATTRAIERSNGLYARVRTVADLAAAKRAGALGIIYSFEAVAMLEDKLERIDEFGALGVRVMQLSYNTRSAFAEGVLTPPPTTGLTALGAQAVARMNAGGISVDLSHANEPSSLAAIAASTRPVLITHAGCAAIHPHPRNKSDAVLRALANRGGTIGIYELSFLSAGPAQQSLDEYLAHVAHALDVCGEDHVGIGSDAMLMPFDTSPANLDEWNHAVADRKARGVGAPEEGRPPFVTGLNRPDRMAVIAAALAKRGLASRTIDKVLGGNFRRVFADTWR